MIEIHWLLLLLIISVCSVAGFMLCALLTMGKMADQALEVFKIQGLHEKLLDLIARMDMRSDLITTAWKSEVQKILDTTPISTSPTMEEWSENNK